VKFKDEWLTIRESVKNHEFFADRTIDRWTFQDFLSSKQQDALKRIKTVLQEYRFINLQTQKGSGSRIAWLLDRAKNQKDNNSNRREEMRRLTC
jgi:hypothetical protein